MRRFLERNYKWIVTGMLLFVAIVSTLGAWNDSLIFDEDAHIPAGYSYVTEHDLRLNPEHPPLLKDFAGLMLLPLHLKFDTTKPFWTTDINGQWDAGHDLLWQEGNNADLAIFLSRLPFVLLAILFGLFLFKWGCELAGIEAGLFALALYAFDPNILGHNHFVTTDLGIAAFMTFSFYYFLRFVKNPTWKNMIVGGIFLGLVQLVKFSSITLFPIYGLVLLIYPFTKINRDGENNWKFKFKKLGEYLGKGVLAFGVSLIVVWGVYFMNIYKMPEQKLTDTIENYFPHDDQSASARAVNSVTVGLNKSIITRPLSGYILGIAMVFKRVDGGNGAYFMGQVSSHAFHAYFPTVFAIKEPLINLLLMLTALLLSFWVGLKILIKKFSGDEPADKKLRLTLKDAIRHNIVSISLFSFVFLYAYISITGNLNIGFRHLFPILPFIYLLTANTIFHYLKRLDKYARFNWHIVLAFLLLFLAAGTISAYPNYMSYFNQSAGGPKNGFHYATDSNADWGQDLKRLKIWVDDYNNCARNADICEKCCMKNNSPLFPEAFSLGPIDQIHIDYFGGANTHYYFGDQALDWWDSKRPIETGWYAVSTNFLMGSIHDSERADEMSYRWIQNLTPVTQVGTSIFVYYVTPEQAAAAK